MIAKIDSILDRITMYRAILYALLGMLGVAEVLAFFKLLSFSPLSLLVSTIFLVVMCWAMNRVLAYLLAVPVNIESAYITALILALIIDPARTPTDFQFLGWTAILAMSSKYILALYNKHLFNPVAIAVVITAYILGESASWWVGTAYMLPIVLVAGWLVVRKIRQEDMCGFFCGTVLVGVCLSVGLQGGNSIKALQQLLLQSPLFFFAFIMLTEPLTAPHTKNLKRIFSVLVGILFIPQLHLAALYFTPELAVCIGNIFAYWVSPKQKVLLKLSKKIKMDPQIIDFVFKSPQKLAFVPGQYMEFTLEHDKPDSRGNRRYFTLASSPTEETVHLGVRFYEKSSSYKQAMYNMDHRTSILAAQIAGDFTLPNDSTQKLVFIAGGIGITPFRSMLKYLLDTQEQRDIVLLYANKMENEIVYRNVLDAVQTKLGVRVFCTLTDTANIPHNWPGLVGRINEEMITKLIPDYQQRTFYISGPPEMVKGSEHVLKNIHVKQRQIKKDFFPGLV